MLYIVLVRIQLGIICSLRSMALRYCWSEKGAAGVVNVFYESKICWKAACLERVMSDERVA